MAATNGKSNKSGGKKVAAAAKKAGKISFGVRLVIFLILAGALAISLIWQDGINSALGLKKTVIGEYDGMGTSEVLSGSGGDLNLHFVDVGQGDACVIELPDERNMLIDSGSSDSDDKLIKYIESNIKTQSGSTIEYFDIVVLTHSDEDHCGEMSDVLSRFPAKTFYRPNQLANRSGFTDPGIGDLYGDYSSKNTIAYMDAIAAGYREAEITFATNATDAAQNVIAPADLNESDEGYYEINFYSPVREKYTDYNDYSPIIILEYEDNRVALSGDAEAKAEADFVELAGAGAGRYSVFDETFTVQAIKLGHHGSRTSSSERYLETLTTQANRKNVIIIISCGLNNKYGHPHPEVLQRLQEMGFAGGNMLRTDKNGDIAMSIKYDESVGKYSLFVGADAVKTEKTSLTLGSMSVAWQEIVIALIILAAAVLIVVPFIYDLQKKAKKARKSTKNKR